MVLESFFDRSKVSARYFTANDLWCPSDLISSVLKENEGPRSSRSLISSRYRGLFNFLILTTWRASLVLVGTVSSRRRTAELSISTTSGLAQLVLIFIGSVVGGVSEALHKQISP